MTQHNNQMSWYAPSPGHTDENKNALSTECGKENHMLITKFVESLQRQADRNEAVLEQLASMMESIRALAEMSQTTIISATELFESMSQMEYKMRQAYIACNGKDDCD